LERYLRINYYTKIQTDALVENRYCRIVALMRDNMISTSSDEYLRRYYKFAEITERIPKIAKYYRNYLLFFCKPIFSNLFINKLIHVYGELKGELYYNQNYGNKNKENEKDERNKNNNNNNINTSASKKNRGKTPDKMLHTTIKNEIDKNSMTISTICKDNSYLNMNPLNDEMNSNVINNNKNNYNSDNYNNKGNKTQNNFNKFSLNSVNNLNENKNFLPLYYNDKNKDLNVNINSNSNLNQNTNLRKSNDIKNINSKKNEHNNIIYNNNKNPNTQKGNNNFDNLNMFNNNNHNYNNNQVPSSATNINKNNINHYAKENLGSKIIRKNSTGTNMKYSSSKY
jgi:hypothetical protein